jgi:alkylhydroperoxidase family enzyme
MPRIQPDDSVPLPILATSGSSTMTTLFQTMSHRPIIMQAALQLVEAAMRTGTVEEQLKELLAIRVSQVNLCHY